MSERRALEVSLISRGGVMKLVGEIHYLVPTLPKIGYIISSELLSPSLRITYLPSSVYVGMYAQEYLKIQY